MNTLNNDALRKLRTESNLSQENIAYLMQIEQSSYSRLENGKTKLKIEHIPKIAKAINKSQEEIMNRLSGCTLNNLASDAEMLKILLKEKDKCIALLEKLLENKKYDR